MQISSHIDDLDLGIKMSDQLPAADVVNATTGALPESTNGTWCVSTSTAPSSTVDSVTISTDTANVLSAPSESEASNSLFNIASLENDECSLPTNAPSDPDKHRPCTTHFDEAGDSLETTTPLDHLTSMKFNELTIKASEKLDKFTIFPDLPLELRRQIWKDAIVPRLVHWRPGCGKPPGIMHACRDSRGETFMVSELRCPWWWHNLSPF